MGVISNYASNKAFNHLTGNAVWTLPSDGSRVWIALCTASSTGTSTGATITEVPNSNAYARLSTTASVWNAASGGSNSNSGILQFADATGSWGTVTSFALVDSGTWGAGNVLAYGDFTTSKAIASGGTAQIAATAMAFSFTSGSPISNYLRNLILNHIVGQAQWTAPTNMFIALTTSAPVVTTAGSALAEPSGSGYARLSTGSGDWISSTAEAISNNDILVMSEATGSWASGSPLTDVVLCDASTNGNVLLWGVPGTSKTYAQYDAPRFIVGDLSFTLN